MVQPERGYRFALDSVLLARFATVPDDPRAVAEALATTLAACDFPPVDDHASQPRVRAALRTARVAHPALVDPAS